MSGDIAHQFKMLALDFLAVEEVRPKDPGEAKMLWLHDSKLQGRFGQLVIQAHRAGQLELQGLAKLVAFHTSRKKAIGAQTKRVAVLVRCPENLCIEVVGANQVEFLNTQPLQVSPLRSGGLLPRLGLLPESTPLGPERFAKACEVLAGLIEEMMRAVSKPFSEIRLAQREQDILESMAESKNRAMLLVDTIIAANYSKEATRESLKQLQVLGLVAKPEGAQRKGFVITDRGRKYVVYLREAAREADTRPRVRAS
ncbi:MAG TPA: hypothetical protein VJZ71_16625 [Phycisphaerae bacterium]|nr:hypothetical protein [Phycisphaerae bacterium]